eukprot:3016168-Pleurochrysis_carterae.AAC.1
MRFREPWSAADRVGLKGEVRVKAVSESTSDETVQESARIARGGEREEEIGEEREAEQTREQKHREQ